MFSQCDCGFWQWKDIADCAGAATSSQGAPETSPALGNHGPVDGYPSQSATRANGLDAPADFWAEVDRLLCVGLRWRLLLCGLQVVSDDLYLLAVLPGLRSWHAYEMFSLFPKVLYHSRVSLWLAFISF